MGQGDRVGCGGRSSREATAAITLPFKLICFFVEHKIQSAFLAAFKSYDASRHPLSPFPLSFSSCCCCAPFPSRQFNHCLPRLSLYCPLSRPLQGSRCKRHDNRMRFMLMPVDCPRFPPSPHPPLTALLLIASLCCSVNIIKCKLSFISFSFISGQFARPCLLDSPA